MQIQTKLFAIQNGVQKYFVSAGYYIYDFRTRKAWQHLILRIKCHSTTATWNLRLLPILRMLLNIATNEIKSF